MEFKRAERLLKALGNRRRLQILELLSSNGGMSVGRLAAELSIPLKTASKHLAILLLTDIVGRKQTGNSAEITLLMPLHPYVKVVLNSFRS